MSKKRSDVSSASIPAIIAHLDPCGIPNLDLVLGGGLPRGALVIVAGPPGSGKTTLANQMAFAAAHSGRKAMVLTALSEPTSKLIDHLRSFTFFDEDLLGESVQFLSLQQFLAEGLAATGDEMIAAARQFRANFVVLDGFRGVRGADVDPQAAREFLYDVGTTLSVLGATTIITSEADPRDPSFFPEATTADVIIGLHYGLNGVRHQRAIEAIKMRGAAPLSGLHGLGLSAAGTVVYPRLESRIAATDQPGSATLITALPSLPAAHAGRTTFDLPELDALLGGGLTYNTNSLLVGSLGTGKTFLALHYALAGARAGEPTLFVGFRETLQQLIDKTAPFALGADLQRALAPGGNLAILRVPPVELEPDILADRLLTIIDERGIRRLVMDSIAELEHAAISSGGRVRVSDYIAALVEALRARNVTALYLKEIRQQPNDELDFSNAPISVLAENVIHVRQIEQRAQLHRVLTVLKMRFSAHDESTLREFVILPPQGVRMLSLDESRLQDPGASAMNLGQQTQNSSPRGTKTAGQSRKIDESTPEEKP